MKRSFDNQEREWTPAMRVEEFIEVNEDIISEYYIESYPQEARKISDGDLEGVRDYAYEENKEFYEEIMHDFYQDHINGL